MIITFSPQVKLADNEYLFVKVKDDILYVKYEDKEEEYDFTNMGEGELQGVESSNISIEPLFKAKRTKEDLYVTIYRPIPPTNDESLNFPEPIDTSEYDLSDYDKDPLYIYLEELYIENEVPDGPTEPGGEPVEDPKEPVEDLTAPEEEEELGEPEVIKLTEHEYSKEENIDYTPIVDEVIVEHELEPVPDIEAPEPIEPDDGLLKTPEFTDIESALEQAYLEEEERKLQEELARQRELEEKLMEEQMAEIGTEFDEEPPLDEPVDEPVDEVPTIDDYSEEEPTEPNQGDETLPSEVLDGDEYDYTSEEETALEDNTELNNEVDNNG
ncbi:hypothetical protein AVP_92 [Aerococcus phage vB_AviM_AVP]|nr:hypothetical protein AVP_92 [Aerococcus phage vB_AviM_AVP]